MRRAPDARSRKKTPRPNTKTAQIAKAEAASSWNDATIA